MTDTLCNNGHIENQRVMKILKRLIDTVIISTALLLAVACMEKTPPTSDTERLIGEALEAVGNHDLRTAEQRAYSAAILSADSAEMADAMTMLSLVFILEDKKQDAEMVMAVLPAGQTMEFVRLQQAANEQGRSRDRYFFGGFIGLLLVIIVSGIWWSRRRKAAFERKVDELMQSIASTAKNLQPSTFNLQPSTFNFQPSTLRSDIVRTKQGVDVLYAILHNENISQMGKREQQAVAETLHIVEPELADLLSSIELTPKETFYCIMQYYGKTEQQKAQCFCCTEQALRSTKSRLGKKLDLRQLESFIPEPSQNVKV
jgi:cobalamin biosynthesis Mg chelatase CobN